MHVKQPHNALNLIQQQILNVIPKNRFYPGVNNSEKAYDWDFGILLSNFQGFWDLGLKNWVNSLGYLVTFKNYLGIFFLISLKICRDFDSFLDISADLLAIWDSIFLAERTSYFPLGFIHLTKLNT